MYIINLYIIRIIIFKLQTDMKHCISIFIIFLLFFFSTQCNDKCQNNLLESINRRIYSFNRGVDKILLIPSSSAYINFIPQAINDKINNFYTNIFEIQNLFFYLIFYNFEHFLVSFSRVTINSTLGLFGLFDISKKSNLLYKDFNFNIIFQTYKSTYMMLPIIGPGTIRTNVYLLCTQILNPIIYIFNRLAVYYFLEIIVKRSTLMFDTTFFHKTMLDGYSFLKDIYIQNMENENNKNNSFLNEPDD